MVSDKTRETVQSVRVTPQVCGERVVMAFDEKRKRRQMLKRAWSCMVLHVNRSSNADGYRNKSYNPADYDRTSSIVRSTCKYSGLVLSTRVPIDAHTAMQAKITSQRPEAENLATRVVPLLSSSARQSYSSGSMG